MDIPKGTKVMLFVTGIIFCIVTTFTFLVGGAVTDLDPSENDGTSPGVVVPADGPIVIKGTMLCLPHKNTSGTQTMECAYGLKDDMERYFALSDSDPNYMNIIGVPMNVQVQVEGIFGARANSNYQDIGIISVTKITAVNTTPANASGIRGRALLGPTCPVERNPPDPACADKPYQTSLVVTTADGAKVVKEFSTDGAGLFSISLPPGSYAIRSGAASNIRPYCQSNGTIEVKQSAFADATISCDTGIR